MLLTIEKSGEQDQERSEEWLVNTRTEFLLKQWVNLCNHRPHGAKYNLSPLCPFVIFVY